MPSGKVHDWVTVGTAAAAVPVVYLQVDSLQQPLAWLAIATYTFSGIWLSSDLDIESSAYKRWGPLRWLWWPYQKMVPHRSWISHGLGVGPLLRAGYLLVVGSLLAVGAVWGAQRLGIAWDADPHSWLRNANRLFTDYPSEWIAICIGLVAGGAAHSLLDFAHTRLKRMF